MQVDRVEPASAEVLIAGNMVSDTRIHQSPREHPLGHLQTTGPVDAVKIRVSVQPGIYRPYYIARVLFSVRGKRQCGEILVPARFPYVLDIAHCTRVADVQSTGESALNLPLVAVITMPIELESHRKVEIEHLDILNRRTAIMQFYRVRLGAHRCPVIFRHRWCSFPVYPVNWQHRGGASTP